MEDRLAFIRANTQLQRPPHAPELQLWLADEVTPLWRKTEAELDELGLPPPFWAFAWAGGQAVARYLLDRPEEVAGKRVLDFATGSGVGAVAAALAGAAAVSACDVDPFAEAAVAMNAQANGVSVDFTRCDLLKQPAPEVEVLLAGDIFYENPLSERVLEWLHAAHKRGDRVLLGDPGRTYFPREGLVQLAAYQVQTTRELESSEIKNTGVWTFA